MRIAWVLALTACWSSAAVPPPRPSPEAGYEITMSRTPCMGLCPIYTVAIHADGRVDYRGTKDVAEVGERHGTADAAKLTALVADIKRVAFFSLDHRGRLHPKPECRPDKATPECERTDDVMCTDTSSTVIEISRGSERNRIALTHCEELAADALEAAIDAAAKTKPWVLGPE